MKLNLIASLFFILMFANCSNDKLQEAVSRDFAIKMSGYQLISAIPGEGDLTVRYMHIKCKDRISETIKDTVWQYWDLKQGWTHRDEYLKIVERKENSN
ncbi:MAG: hypothetical protein IPJ79_10585 [Bacteroidetes bacterium]|nr:hypothetical protein [Bacteroidota bacterium]